MLGMDGMQKMTMSGDTDKDFAMMMKMHHQQALNMAEMELAHGKSPEMKTMAKQIIVAQKKEIAQFDKWLARQKQSAPGPSRSLVRMGLRDGVLCRPRASRPCLPARRAAGRPARRPRPPRCCRSPRRAHSRPASRGQPGRW